MTLAGVPQPSSRGAPMLSTVLAADRSIRHWLRLRREVKALDGCHGAAVGPGDGASGIEIEHGDALGVPRCGDGGGGFLDGSLFEAGRMVGQVMGRSGRRGRGRRATPARDTGCSPTQRARTAQPAGQSAQLVNLARISPRSRPRNSGPVFAPQRGIRDQAPRGRREEGACHGAAGEFEDVSAGGFI